MKENTQQKQHALNMIARNIRDGRIKSVAGSRVWGKFDLDFNYDADTGETVVNVVEVGEYIGQVILNRITKTIKTVIS